MGTTIKKSDYLSYEFIKQLHNNVRFISCFNKEVFYLFDAQISNIYQLKGDYLKIMNIRSKKNMDKFVNGISWKNVKIKYATLNKILNIKHVSYSIGKSAANLSTNSITINPDSVCNLSCSYCFSNKSINKNSINIELYEKLINDFANKYAQNNPLPTICYRLTSEPFLDIYTLEHLVDYAEKAGKATNKTFDFYYCTNGTVLNERILKILHRSMRPTSILDISLDGPKEIHDKVRKSEKGRGSYDTIIKNLKKIQAEGIKTGFASVITNAFPYPAKILQHHLKLNPSRVSIKPIRSQSPLSFNEDSLKNLFKGYDDYYLMIKKWISNKNYNKLRIIKDDYGLRIIASLVSKECRKQYCNMNSTNFSVNDKGDFYLCDSMIGIEELKVGNISNGLDSDKFKFDYTTENRSKCKFCVIRNICGGTCYWNSYLNKGNLFETDDIECKIKMYMFKKSLQILIYTVEKHGNIDVLKKIWL